jgi:putative acetyltransferase
VSEAPRDASAEVTIAVEDPRSPEIAELIRALDEYLNALYPPELNYLLDIEELSAAEVSLFVARLEGTAVGIAALRRHDGYAELKRMYVDPSTRGLGLGRRLLEAVEALARAEGFAVICLETGIHQPEALGLYRASGYAERAVFGGYQDDSRSAFMEKRLGG